MRNYRLDVTLDLDHSHLTGTWNVDVEGFGNSKYLEVILGEQFTPSEVLFDGQPTTYTREGDSLLVKIPAKAMKRSAPLQMKYEGRIAPPSHGVTADQIGTDGTFLRAWVDWYPSSNRFVFGEITYRFPEGYDLVSSGTRISTFSNGKARQERWQVKALTRLIFSLGHYYNANELYRGVNLTVFAMKENKDDLQVYLSQMQRSLDTLLKILDSYPYPNLTLVEVPKNFLGGHAGQSMVIITPRQTWSPDEWEEVITHEIAHQWFGNSVNSSDTVGAAFLSEGFASYMQALYTEQQYGGDAFRRSMDDKEFWYKEYTHGIGDREQPLATIQGGDPGYIGIAYDKGAWLLHTLRGQAGDEVFFRALKRYVRENRLQEVHLGTFFWTVFQEAGEEEFDRLAAWFYDWMLMPARPDYHLEKVAQYSRERDYVTELRVGNLGDGGLHRIPVMVETPDGPVEQELSDGILRLVTEKPVHKVTVDPKGRVLDVDRSNNTRQFAPEEIEAEPPPHQAAAAAVNRVDDTTEEKQPESGWLSQIGRLGVGVLFWVFIGMYVYNRRRQRVMSPGRNGEMLQLEEPGKFGQPPQ